GDGSDTVEGQAGTDTLVFNGSNASETIDISANGSRLRLFRDVGNVTMDVNAVEQVNLTTLGGADTITVNDLTGTGVTALNLNLAAADGDSDGQADTVVVNGTTGADVVTVGDAATGCGSPGTWPTSRWTWTGPSGSTSPPSAGPTPSPSTTCPARP